MQIDRVVNRLRCDWFGWFSFTPESTLNQSQSMFERILIFYSILIFFKYTTDKQRPEHGLYLFCTFIIHFSTSPQAKEAP